MIQFNLLPDVKLNYIKAKRSKHTTTVISFLVAGAALAIFVFLFLVVNVAQKKHLRDLNGDVKKYSAQLKAVPDLDKILTIQNQLNSLTSLHDQKPVTSRIFGYVTQTTPSQVTISQLTVDLGAKTVQVQGAADQLSTVNKYVDTLKFTTYSVGDDAQQTPAFSSVVLSGFTPSGKTTTFNVTFSFDPTLFDGTKDVKLNVPKIITTRSETEKPSDVFQTQPTTQGGQ